MSPKSRDIKTKILNAHDLRGVALWFEAFLSRLFFFNETTIKGNAFLLNATIQTKLMFRNRG